MLPLTAPAANPREEQQTIQQWVAEVFSHPRPVPDEPERLDCVTVLRKSHKVLENRSVWDSPLKLGQTQYEHGFYMDAPAAVAVELSRPAVELTAVIGIDNNADTGTHPAAGSARFYVATGGRCMFRSPVLKLGDGGTPIRVPLDGATQVVLEVDDGGNGRGWDQCVWADAVVKLDDGTTLVLGRLPMDGLPPNRSNAPFSFLFGGKPSDRLLGGWEYSEKSQPQEHGVRRVVSYRCPKTGLRIDVEVTVYSDFPAVDWLLRLSNESAAETPVIECLQPLDATILAATAQESIALRSSHGDYYSPCSFMPHDEPLAPGESRELAPHGGRSSNGAAGAFPFYNLLGPDGGWILAVGWSGQWNTRFLRHKDGPVVMRAGMESTHFRLHPGEQVRTPRILLLHYHGPMIRGHNRFRQLMLAHYVPHRDGRPVHPPVCHATAATVYRSREEATEANQLAILRRAAGLGVEAYWLDAYWYPRPWESNVGNWYPRCEDFPRGLKPLADAAHQAGMKFILWFEPERVAPGTQFDREHPEFLIKLGEQANRLFNLGDPKARQFLTGFLDQRIKEWNIDIYRNDFNIDPLPYWQKNDAPDRQGMTEMLYVEGLYRMWSELLARHPGLLIDNCASGGRRIDLETSSLAWTLWRSDLNDIGEGLKGADYWPQMGRADQNHVAGISLYLPFQSGPLWNMHPYGFRSAMTSSAVLYEWIMHKDFPDQLAAQGIAELKRLRPFFLGDFYPLAEITESQAAWFAYQFDRPDLRGGIALFFRRPESRQTGRRFRLENINPEAIYLVTITGETYDQGKQQRMAGRALAELEIYIPQQPGSALVEYQRAE